MSNQDAGHGIAAETLSFREGLEASRVKTKYSATGSPHPKIVARVLRQRVDAGVGQPVLLGVSVKTGAIKPREPAAIISGPKFAAASCQYGHDDVVRKAVCL